MGVAHRDLKPENLLLDKNYNLKIADFGFAAPVQGRDNSGTLKTRCGTLNYMAPEIHLNQPYNGQQVDIFSAGIILFIMVASHPPFTTAEPKDPFYRCIGANREEIFWQIHSKNKPDENNFFSESFKSLVQQMLQLDPTLRPTIEDICKHPWMQGDVPSFDQVQDEFTERDIRNQTLIEEQKK